MTEQLMAIYPIIPGQKSADRNVIPPHVSGGHTATATKHTAQDASADLIDFGQSQAPAAPVPAENPAVAIVAEKKPSQNSTEISQMLSSTGEQAHDGPLIDFTSDMKHNLPTSSQSTHPSNLKRSETEESNDAFFDAEP